jgi:hypothetical protein
MLMDEMIIAFLMNFIELMIIIPYGLCRTPLEGRTSSNEVYLESTKSAALA